MPAGYRWSMTEIVVTVLLALPAGVLAAEPDMMRPRVPADKLAAAQALTSPLPDSPETIDRGKAIYQGKGTCFQCHGVEGGGDGPFAERVAPAPRNFQQQGFWRHRSEGEVFWVIKHGSPGTSMIGFGDQLTDKDIWALMHYARTFSRQEGPGAGMPGKGSRAPMGPGSGLGQGRVIPREGEGTRDRGRSGCCDGEFNGVPPASLAAPHSLSP